MLKRVIIRRIVSLSVAMASLAASAQTIPLVKGWNLVGNSGTTAINVSSAFGSVSGVTTVWTWNATTNKWAFYTPALSSTELATYAAGKGYDILSSIGSSTGFWVNASAALNLPMGSTCTVQTTTAGSYSGTYSGNYTGGDSGTWTVTISSAGALTGTGTSSAGGSATGTGTVGADGALKLTLGSTSNGSVFAGTLEPTTKAISGIWSNNAEGTGGSFSGTRTGQ